MKHALQNGHIHSQIDNHSNIIQFGRSMQKCISQYAVRSMSDVGRCRSNQYILISLC